jgi:DtxR family Mn-dependent transcriptional regulator
VAVEGPQGSNEPDTTVDLGSPAAQAIWVVG